MIIRVKKIKKIRLYRNIAFSACTLIIAILVITLMLNKNISDSNNIKITANDKENNEVLEKTFIVNYDTDELIDLSDTEVLKNTAEQIIIGKISNIDGCTNYSEGLNMYTRINTLGDIEVLQVLKGNLSVGDKIPFIRGGGTLTYSEYEKGIIYGNRDKVPDTYGYVKEMVNGDIEVEEGKTYLMFLYYDVYNQRYEIIANQYGLREYNLNTEKVMNNITKEWENLEK
jgi:hypothetical protein